MTMSEATASAGQDEALGAATRWVIERFAAPQNKCKQAGGEPSEPVVKEADWKLSPSVGTWLMQLPRQLAKVEATPESKGPAKAVTSTPSKASRAKSPSKSATSPKVDLQRSPRRTAPPAVSPATVKNKNESSRDRAASPKVLVAAQGGAEGVKQEANTPSKQRLAPTAQSAQKREAASPRPSPKVPARTSPAKVAAPVPVKELHAVAVKEAPEATPDAAASVTPQPELKTAAPASECAPQAKATTKAAAAPKAASKVPEATRAKSPSVRPAATPRGTTAPRAALAASQSAAKLSSAEIEVQKIEEARKEARLLAQKNAQRMKRAASAKTLQAPGKENEAAAAATQTPEAKPSSRPVQARPPSPVRKTSPSAKETPRVAAKAKAVVAATPTPSKNATSPRPRQAATGAAPASQAKTTSRLAAPPASATPRAASASRKASSPQVTGASSKLTRVPSASLRVAKKPMQPISKEAENQKAAKAAAA